MKGPENSQLFVGEETSLKILIIPVAILFNSTMSGLEREVRKEGRAAWLVPGQ